MTSIAIPTAAVAAPPKLSLLYGSLWLAYLILRPFYLMPSGLPQLGDLLAVGLVVGVFLQLGWRTVQPFSAVVVVLLCFVSYVSLVDFGWGAITGQLSILVKPAYYVFNLLVLVTFLVLYSRAGAAFLRLTLLGVSLSVFLQVVLSAALFSSNETLRQSLFFNNPNQLGYYALICTVIFAYASHLMRVHPVHQVLFFLAALYLTVLSLSKAAILGAVIAALILFLRRPFIGLAITSIALLWLYQVPPGQEMRIDLERRFSTVGIQEDDSWSGRGYDRIGYHPDLLLLGAGEGGYARFTSEISGTELHSTWGTVLFSYGLPGAGLFCLFLGLLFVLAGPTALLYFLPVAIYGLTHNGLRFTMLWILLALLLAVAHSVRQERVSGRTGWRRQGQSVDRAAARAVDGDPWY